MFNRVKVALARCLCYRALELARDRKRRYWGTAHPRPEHGPLWPDRDTAGPVRYPAGHSSGPPHVDGDRPAPRACACGCGRTGCGWCGSTECQGCGPL